MKEGYDQNKPKELFSAMDLAADIIVKHASSMNPDLIADIATMVKEAYEDGYCNALANNADKPEWYAQQDADKSWVASHDLDDLDAFWEELDARHIDQLLIELKKIETDLITDEDQAWIDDAAKLTLEELEAYDDDTRWGKELREDDDLPPGSPFDRKNKDE